MESCYKNISKIRKVTVRFSKFKKKCAKTYKKIEKIHIDSEKSINSFKIEKRIGHLIIYRTIVLFDNLLITFRHYYYAKYMFLTSSTLGAHTYFFDDGEHFGSM